MANQKSIYTLEMQVLTARIKEMRLAAGLTQRELAQRLGKRTHTAILKLEQGQVRVELLELRRICHACDVSFLEFITQVDEGLEQIESRATEE